MADELHNHPPIPCSFSKQGAGFVIYIGAALAQTVLEKMPLSKNTKEAYMASFDEENEKLTIQKARI